MHKKLVSWVANLLLLFLFLVMWIAPLFVNLGRSDEPQVFLLKYSVFSNRERKVPLPISEFSDIGRSCVGSKDAYFDAKIYRNNIEIYYLTEIHRNSENSVVNPEDDLVYSCLKRQISNSVERFQKVELRSLIANFSDMFAKTLLTFLIESPSKELLYSTSRRVNDIVGEGLSNLENEINSSEPLELISINRVVNIPVPIPKVTARDWLYIIASNIIGSLFLGIIFVYLNWRTLIAFILKNKRLSIS